jgi:hypothetical protein
MRARALLASGFLMALTALAVSGCANGAGGSASGLATNRPADSAAGCTTDAYRAIRAHERLTRVPAACQALTLGQRNEAVGLAIRMASGTGSKSARRRQAGTAAAYVSGLITDPAPTLPAPSASSAPGGMVAASSGSRLGFNELATEVAALLAWLATAGSGGWILIRWWRAGGRPASPRGPADTAAPSVVILGHVGLGLLGLAVWALFLITGWAALAWISLGLLAPVAGLGMTVLISGLPRPRSPGSPAAATAVPAAPAASSSRTQSGRQPVAAIAAHGLFVLATLLLVLLAAIGA